MKKIGIILVGMLLMLLIGMSNVLAAVGTVTLEGEEKATVGSKQKIVIKVQTDGADIGVVSGKVKAEGNITIEKVASTDPEKWQLTYNNQEGAEEKGTFISLNPYGSKEDSIIEVDYTASNTEGTGKIILEGVRVTNIEYQEENIGNIVKEIKVEKKDDETPAEKTLSSIKITKAPTKTVYVKGEKFDKAGMEITAEYSDGSSKVVTNYTCEPTEALKVTDKIITIKYTEGGVTKTVEQKIKVQEDDAGENDGQTEKTLTSIEITKAPTKTVYNKDEKFDKAGMEVTAKYSDGSSKIITDYTYAPTEKLKLTDKVVTIKYTENGITKTVEQKIKVQEKAGDTQDPDNTVSDKEYPDTGVEMLIIPIAAIVMIGVISYIGYRKYKNI